MKLRKRAKHLKRTQKCWIVVQDHPQWGALLERCVPGKVRPFTGPLRNINWDAFERMVLEAAWGSDLLEQARALVSGVVVDVDAALDPEDE